MPTTEAITHLALIVNDEPRDSQGGLSPGEEAVDGDGFAVVTVARYARDPVVTDIRPKGQFWMNSNPGGDLFWSGGGGVWEKVRSTTTVIPIPDIVDSFPEFIDTFPNGLQTVGTPVWTIGVGGPGAALSQIAPPVAGGRNGVVGVLGLFTGTNSGGRAGAILGANLLRFESGSRYTLWFRATAIDLATVAQDYRVRFGFIDDPSATEPVDGVYFEYHRAVSPNWLCKTALNNTRTQAATLAAVAPLWWSDFKIDVDGTAGTSTFYIDDVMVAQITANVPSAVGRETSIGFVMHKTAGSTTRSFAIDRVYLKLNAP